MKVEEENEKVGLKLNILSHDFMTNNKFISVAQFSSVQSVSRV